MPDLKPCAECFGRPQLFDSITDGLSGRCEPLVVFAAVLGRTAVLLASR
jgi:hypothetical protein